MRFRLILLVIATVVVTGCEKDPVESFTPEVFTGELSIARLDIVFSRTDTVMLIVEGNNYQLQHITRHTNLCDSKGTIKDFGRNMLTLNPFDLSSTSNCDNTRIPLGQFTAIFTDDSLLIGPKELTFTFTIDEQVVEELWQYYFNLKQSP